MYKDGQAEIVVKLLSSGRYIWSISVMCGVDDTDEGIKLIKSINNKLQQEFPDYAKRGSGRIANLDED
jgi:hypothetical protein